MEPIISLAAVTKVYDGTPRPALGGIDLDIEKGRFTAVMGPSGGGKSTLLNIIGALDRPTGGRVTVAGLDVTRLSEAGAARFRRSNIGLVFQFFHLLEDLTVIDNVLIPARLAGVGSTEARDRATTLLEQLGIAAEGSRYPATLSGGQRQRVAIARALINRPPILLADEPTGALDSQTGDGVLDLFRDLNRTGQTIVLVTHDERLAAASADRIVHLVDGQIDADGPTDSTGRAA
ncbi:MAG TPA: ABC transporter ATP-binding protein [Candidatus Acidoferrum sp.]|nr:ABC transporter ATP-binding protein [Candidatus Acidoferrum sp.]